MGKQLGNQPITIEEIHKTLRVTKEMREEKYRKNMCVTQNHYI